MIDKRAVLSGFSFTRLDRVWSSYSWYVAITYDYFHHTQDPAELGLRMGLFFAQLVPFCPNNTLK